MNTNLTDILSHSELFQDISKSDIETFLVENNHKIVSYTKNDVFAVAGDKCNDLIVVIEGTLIARMVSDSGKYIQMDKISEGRVVAPAMLFATDGVFPVNVTPEDNVKVLVMRKDIFWGAMQKNGKLLFNFMQIVSDINRFLSNRIHSLSLKSIRGKLGEFFLQEAEWQGENIIVNLKLTRQELADKFAISRQSLIRSLTELEDEGLISIEGKTITILDRNRLDDEE